MKEGERRVGEREGKVHGRQAIHELLPHVPNKPTASEAREKPSIFSSYNGIGTLVLAFIKNVSYSYQRT